MSVAGLIQTMNQLVQIHQDLLELSQMKTGILVTNQVDKLNQIVNKETSLVKRVTELDQQRIKEISEFLLEKGYKPNPKITIGDLTKVIAIFEDKVAIGNAQGQLLETLDKLKKRNVLNLQLIEQSLAYIDYSVDLMLPQQDDLMYHNPGQQQQNGKRIGVFDRKA